MSWLKWALLGGVGLYALNKIGMFSIGSTLNFRLGNFGFTSGGIDLNLIAQNPQDAGFVVNSVVGNVLLGSTVVGNISSFSPVTIAPNSETPIRLTIRPSLTGALSLLSDVIKGNVAKQPITVSGNVNAGGTVLPLNLSV